MENIFKSVLPGIEVENDPDEETPESETIEQRPTNIPWIEKYRPSNLDGIVSQNRIISMLRRYITKHSLPHLLFYGPPGTGKTSTIMATAKELYGDYYRNMVMELNASDDRGIDVVRTRIQKFVMTDSMFFNGNGQRKRIFKLVILDETDAMTGDAQAILRKVVEKYSYNARFCLICNTLKKIIAPLQSRCAMYRFAPLPRDEIVMRILGISEAEGIDTTEDGAKLIARKSNGDMRRVLNTLQSVAMTYERVDSESISRCLCYPKSVDMNILINGLCHQGMEENITQIVEYQRNHGISLHDILDELGIMIRNSIIGRSEKDPLDEFTMIQKAQLLDQLRVIESNLATTTNDKMQLYGLVSIFHLYRPKAT